MPTSRHLHFEQDPQSKTYALLLEIHNFDDQGGQFVMELLSELNEADVKELKPIVAQLPADGYRPGERYFNANAELLPREFRAVLEDKVKQLSKRSNAPKPNLTPHKKQQHKDLLEQLSQSAKALYMLKKDGSLSDNAFLHCTKLRVFTTGVKLTKLPDSAFDGCINLHTLAPLRSLTKIARFALRNCSSLSGDLHFSALISIGAQAFYKTNFTSLTLPPSIRSLGVLAFAYSAIRTLVFPENIKLGFFVPLIGPRTFELARLTVHCPQTLYDEKILRPLTVENTSYENHPAKGILFLTTDEHGNKQLHLPAAGRRWNPDDDAEFERIKSIVTNSRRDNLRCSFVDAHFDESFRALTPVKKLEYIAEHYPDIMLGDLALIGLGDFLKAIKESTKGGMMQGWEAAFIEHLSISSFFILASFHAAKKHRDQQAGITFLPQDEMVGNSYQGDLLHSLLINMAFGKEREIDLLKTTIAKADVAISEREAKINELQAQIAELDQTRDSAKKKLANFEADEKRPALAEGAFAEGSSAVFAASANEASASVEVEAAAAKP